MNSLLLLSSDQGSGFQPIVCRQVESQKIICSTLIFLTFKFEQKER